MTRNYLSVCYQVITSKFEAWWGIGAFYSDKDYENNVFMIDNNTTPANYISSSAVSELYFFPF